MDRIDDLALNSGVELKIDLILVYPVLFLENLPVGLKI